MKAAYFLIDIDCQLIMELIKNQRLINKDIFHASLAEFYLSFLK